MELYHYLPSYPDFYNNLKDVIGSDDEEDDLPYTSLLKKKEFFENKLDRIELKNPGKLMKHQTFISRFMSLHTPYNGILLMHEPGTGKTCASVGAIEQIRKENSNYKALVIMKGQSLIDNYRNELVYKCTDGIYVPSDDDDEDDLSLSQIERRKRKKLRESVKNDYTFETFEKFSREIAKMTPETIKRDYKNLIVVIDEVHNLRQNKSSKQYKCIHHFLHLITNCKIILMTGTPMRDDPYEIADIMNLILPLGEQIETSRFNELYMNDDDIRLLDKKNELKKLLRGRVSYLKSMKSDVTKKFIGELFDTTHALLYPIKMESIQAKNYKRIYENDTAELLKEKEQLDDGDDDDDDNEDDDGKDVKEDGTKKKKKKKKMGAFYLQSRMASLFVYPDGSTGKDGFDTYIEETKYRFGPMAYTMRKPLRDAIMDGVDDEKSNEQKTTKMLSNIRKYGCKYAECIEKILNSPEESHFVYMEFVRNSGAILFTKLLELFNFSDSLIAIERPKLRYVLLTGEKKNASKEIEIFNRDNNAKGQYIKVIIGSSVLAEGVTLKNVQNVHILTPSWNFSETDQVIARAFRLFSHDSLKAQLELEKIEKNIIVKIYLYCAIFDDDKNRSIDWKMFKTSENKDISIKSIERALKEISVDCVLNKERNMELAVNNNKRECEYMECAYMCEEEPSILTVNETNLDTSTYNLYYDNDLIKHYISIISGIFQTRYKITFLELLRTHNKDSQTLMKAVYHMISHNYLIKDKLGFHCFLRQEHDYLYLTHTLKTNHTFLDVYYVEHFPLQQNLYDEHFTVLQKRKITEMCETLTSSDVMKTQDIIKFPIEVQEMMFKMAIQHEFTADLDEKSIKNRDAILSHFKNKRFRKGDTIIITIRKPFQCFSISSQEWSVCNDDQGTIIDTKIPLNRHNYKHVGQLVNENGKGIFKIIDVEQSEKAKKQTEKSTGRVCTTLAKEVIFDMIDKAKVEMNDITDAQFQKEVGLSSMESISKLVQHIYITNKDGKLHAKFNPIRKLYTKEELMQKSKDDIIRILYWGGSKVTPMCNRLMQWFDKNDMMYDENNQKININDV